MSTVETPPGSNELRISHSAVIHVNTDDVYAAAEHLTQIRDRLGHARDRLSYACALLSPCAPLYDGIRVHEFALAQRGRFDESLRRGTALSITLYEVAHRYELVELQIAAQIAQHEGRFADAQVLRLRAEELIATHPSLLTMFGSPESGSSPNVFAPAANLGAILMTMLKGLGPRYGGLITRDRRLSGEAPPVVLSELVRQVFRGREAVLGAAANSLADLASRMPQGESQIRVETMVGPDGEREYLVFIAGTQMNVASDAPFGAQENLDLFGGNRSATLAAVEAALSASGAQPGDVVHLVGHSQGGLVANWLSVEGQYDVRTVVTFGTPAHAQHGEETLVVDVAHLEDPVTHLRGDGFSGPIGSEDSLMIDRLYTGNPSIEGVQMDAHHMTSYQDTAAMIDSSEDPRVEPIRDRLYEWSQMETVEVREYSAALVPEE